MYRTKMNKEFYIAFCFSAAVHAAVVGVSPSLHKEIAGESGDKQDIVVLGILEMAMPPVEETHTELPEDLPTPMDSTIESTVEMDTLPALPSEEIAVIPQETQEHQKQKQDNQPREMQSDVPITGQDGNPGQAELTQGQLQDIRSKYLTGVMRKLEDAKKYPPQAYRRGTEGTTDIEFTISADGEASVANIRNTSRYVVLDQAAKDMVNKGSPFEPIPRELGLQEIRIVVPVAFKINKAKEW